MSTVKFLIINGGNRACKYYSEQKTRLSASIPELRMAKDVLFASIKSPLNHGRLYLMPLDY